MLGVELGSAHLTFSARKCLSSTEYATIRGRSSGSLDDVLPANDNAVITARAHTGISETTNILTPHGDVEIRDLRPGDRVITTDWREARLTHVLAVPAQHKALRFLAPYFGLDRDLIIAPEQLIKITSDAAEHMFGLETVFVPAWAFRTSSMAEHYCLGKDDKMVQLQLDRPAAVCAAGCAIASSVHIQNPTIRVLADDEARAFAAEYRQGYFT